MIYLNFDRLAVIYLLLVSILLGSALVEKQIAFNNLVHLREDYDSSFCLLRARVDSVFYHLGVPRL